MTSARGSNRKHGESKLLFIALPADGDTADQHSLRYFL